MSDLPCGVHGRPRLPRRQTGSCARKLGAAAGGGGVNVGSKPRKSNQTGVIMGVIYDGIVARFAEDTSRAFKMHEEPGT